MDPQVASWVQAGGVLAFATAVYLELRALRPVLAELKGAITAMLEHDRLATAKRLRDPSDQIPRP